jgi:hypothetical protein
VSAEFFYLSRHQKWNTTALYAGDLFPVGKRFSLDAYYGYQNLKGERPNQQLNQLGGHAQYLLRPRKGTLKC